MVRLKKILIETFLTSIAVLLRIVANPAANVFQKRLTASGQHPLLVNFLTYFVLSLVCVVIAIGINWHELPRQFWFYAALSGLLGGLGNGFLVKALQKGEISVLGPINSYKSVVGIVVGIFLLGEVPNLWGLAGVALIVYGSYFVLRTTPEKFTWRLLYKPEIRFRLWALLLTAIEAVLTKKIILASSLSATFVAWCVFGGLFSLLLLPVYKVPVRKDLRFINRSHLSHYFFLFLCIAVMQATTNYAFAHVPVGYALSLFQLSTLVSVLFGYRLFGEKDIRKKLLGSAIMIAGSVLIILLKQV